MPVAGEEHAGGVETAGRVRDAAGNPAESPLLEREPELGQLEHLIADAVSGAGGAALIEGRAGIGKSALLAATLDRARAAGMTALTARCAELDREIAWGVVRELFEPPLRAASRSERDLLLDGAAGLARGVLGHGRETPPAGIDATAEALHGLHWLTASLAERDPLAIVVDDLHWGDAPSLRFLARLASRSGDLPLLLLGTVRPQRAPGGGEHLAALAAAATVLRPRSLSPQASRRLVELTFEQPTDEQFALACHRATGGNPFLTRELCLELRLEGAQPTAASAERLADVTPDSVSRAVLLRLASLPASTIGLAHAISALGDDVPMAQAAALGELPEADAADAVDALVGAEVLAARLPLRFTHPLVRAAVYEDIAPARKMALHAGAARLLSEAGAPPAEVAAQLLKVEPRQDPEAVATLRAAAESATGGGAPESAATYLRRCLAEPPAPEQRSELLLALATAEAQLGDPRAHEHLREAINTARDSRERALAALALGRLLNVSGRIGECVALADGARAEVGDDDRELGLRLASQAIEAAWQDFATRPTITARLEELAGEIRGGTPSERVLLANRAMRSATMGGEPAERTIELAERALARGQLIAEETADSGACYLAIHSLIAAGRPDRALDHLAKAFDDARERGSPFGFAIASLCRSHAHWALGAVRDAEADARGVLDSPVETGTEVLAPWALAVLVEMLVERGEVIAAQEELERSGLTGELPPSPYFEPLHLARGRLALVRSEPRAALAELLRLGPRAAEAGGANPAMSAWRSSAAQALAAVGEQERAEGLAEEETALARAYGAPPALARALRSLAALRGGEQAIELLREALAALEGSPALLERAHTLVELGAALRRANRRGECQGLLGEGADLADRCGARSLAERARAELQAAGWRPRSSLLSGPDSLTAGELRVARLAAEGVTNRQIAERLFLSLRTVETHLTSSYRKLEIASRRELAAALGPAPAD